VRSIEVSTGTYAVAAPDMELYSPETRVPASGKPFATLQEGSGPVLALAPVADDQLAVGCWNGLVKLWDTRADQVRVLLDAGKTRVHALASTADGRSLAVGYESGQKRTSALYVWDLPTAEPRVIVPCPNKVSAVAFLPDAATLALIGGDGRQRGVLLWDPPDRRERLQMGERLERADCLAVTPDGRYVAAGYRDGRIRLWDTVSGRVDRVLEGHRREVQSLVFSPAGDVLASGSRDGTVRLWSLDTGAEMRLMRGTFNEVRCLTFSPDGRTLATGHAGVAILWSVRTGEKRSTLKAHQFAITSLVYLDEGRTLASAGWDRTVKLWKLEPAIEQ
jgi:WD40 repeat protein